MSFHSNLGENMKKISAIILIIIMFNFIFANFVVYAGEEPTEDPAEETTEETTEESTSSSESSAMSLDEYKSVADDGKATIGSSKMDIELKTSDVGSATSKFGTFLTSVVGSFMKVISNITCEDEAGFNPNLEESDYSAKNTGLFTINSLIFGEFELLNGKIYETPGSEAETIDSPIELVNSVKRLCMRVSHYFVTLAAIIIVVMLVFAIFKWFSAGTAADLAAWKKILARWAICLFLIFIFQYIFITMDVISDSITKGLYNIRLGMEANDYQAFEFTVIKNTIKMYEATGGVTSLGYAFILVLIFAVQVLFLLKYIRRAFSMILLFTIAPVIIVIHSVNLMLGKQSNILGEFFKSYAMFAFIPCIHQLFYLIFFFSLSEMAINVPVLGIILLYAIYRSENIAKAMFGWDLNLPSIFK